MSWLTLLNPALLAFLPMAAIPILLHLLTRHRLKTVEFSAYRFLFDSYIQQRRKLKLVELLIAILRTLFVALLVVLVGRPTIQHWNSLFGVGTGTDVVMLIDTSVSMNTTTGGRTALDRAKAVALAVVARLGPEDRLTLVRLGQQPEEVFSRFASDADAIREAIEGLQASSSRANMLAAFSQVFGQQAPPRDRPVVYLLSDGQASGFRELELQGAGPPLPEGAKLYFVQCGSSSVMANAAVSGDLGKQSRTVVGLPVRLRPRVTSHAVTGEVDLSVRVLINEEEISRTSVRLAPGESATPETVYTPTKPGVFRGKFVIEPSEPGLSDRFPDDDSYLFTLQVAEPLRVLVVNGVPNTDPQDSETLFLRAALTAPDEDVELESAGSIKAEIPGAARTTAELRDIRTLQVREIGEGAVDENTLRGTDVLVLANCGALNGNQFTFIRNYVQNGGGLLVFPGDRVNPDLYNQQFFVFQNSPDRRLVPFQFGPPEGDLAESVTGQRLAMESLDLGHPVFSVFDSPQAKFFTSLRFLRRFGVKFPSEPTESGGGVITLATLSDGVPVLFEGMLGEGRFLLSTFPISNKWSNLPMKPEFVPLVLRMVAHTKRQPGLEVPPVADPGVTAEIGVLREWEPARGTVVAPDGKTVPLEFRSSGARLLAAYDQTDDKGFYTVSVQGGLGDEARQGESSFAVNLDPDESDFSHLSSEQLRAQFPETNIELIDASAETQQELGSVGSDGTEIWRPLIFVLFAVIFCEFVLSTQGGQLLGESDSVSARVGKLNPAHWVGQMTGGDEPSDQPS